MAEGNGREVGNWLAGYLEYTKESESPDSFHTWCGLSAIASVARRNVWLDQGIYLLFPNLYIALVGPPARTAKSTAIRMARRLVTAIPGVKMGPDACSKEQLIREMAEAKLDNKCCLTIHSTELSSIIDTSGILMIQFLTDIFDCDYHNKDGWRYSTKTSGKDQIVNPFLNMLVGTTPSYIADSMPDNVIGHGFTSRTIFVFEEKERHINPRPGLTNMPLMQALVVDLQAIAGLHGEFTWDCDRFGHTIKDHEAAERRAELLDAPCGVATYDRFYHGLYKDIPSDYRLEGYHWRKKIHVLKVAMLLSMAERAELVLDKQVIDAAVTILDDLEGNMSRTFSAVGKYEHASDLERIGAQIINAGSDGLPVSEVFKRNYFAGDEGQIRSIFQSLISMGTITLVNKSGKEWLVPTTKTLPWG